MSDQPGLKRDTTMAVTAQEGEAFLQSQGMAVTDDDVKTRGQKEKLQEVEGEAAASDDQGKPKVARAGTMAVTAEEGAKLLEGEDLEKTRGQTAAIKEAVEESKTTSPQKPRVIRDSTMAVTAQEGAQLLEGEGHLEKTRAQTAAEKGQKSPTTPTRAKRTTTVMQTTEDSTHILGGGERGRTRSQTRKLSEREEEESPKPAVKRAGTMAQTAKEGEEFLQREAKRTKTDNATENAAEAED